MNHTVTKRSVIVFGRKTSISLEDEFWNDLKAIAAAREITLSVLVSEIDARRRGNLSSAIRLAVLAAVRAAPLRAPIEGTVKEGA